MYSRTAICLTRGTVRAVRKYHQGHHKPTTMDDLPVPCGSWQAYYDANQRKYNMQLLAGIGFATFTLIAAKSSGLIELNATVPKI